MHYICILYTISNYTSTLYAVQTKPYMLSNLRPCQLVCTANLRTKIMDFTGFDSSIILIIRGGIHMSIRISPEVLSQRILAGVILVGRLDVVVMSNLISWGLHKADLYVPPKEIRSDGATVLYIKSCLPSVYTLKNPDIHIIICKHPTILYYYCNTVCH